MAPRGQRCPRRLIVEACRGNTLNTYVFSKDTVAFSEQYFLRDNGFLDTVIATHSGFNKTVPSRRQYPLEGIDS